MEQWDERTTSSAIEALSISEESMPEPERVTVPRERIVSPTAEGMLGADSTSNVIEPETSVWEALPSETPEMVRGKTIAKWGIERRGVSRELKGVWEKAKGKLNERGFGVYVDGLVSRIDEVMPRFRDVPYEDAFSGVLQLIQTTLKGRNLLHLTRGHDQVLSDIFQMLTTAEKLTLANHKESLKRLLDEGFTCSVGKG